jgi:hypothetical protein
VQCLQQTSEVTPLLVTDARRRSRPGSCRGLFRPVLAALTAIGIATGIDPAAGQGADVAGLTHHHDGVGKQVTYRSPASVSLTKADVPKAAWTIDDADTTVLCFEDGNNAVFFNIDGEFYAANGKARQFVDFADGDGILLESGELRQVRELEGGLHAELRQIVIDTGLKLCGQKSMDDIAQNVVAASEKPAMTPKQATLLQAAIGIRGAELCRFKLDEVAVVDYLQANDIDLETFNSEMPVYNVIVGKMFVDVGEQEFCRNVLLPRFGPDGMKFVSE